MNISPAWATIIAAVIGAVAAIIVCIVTSYLQHRRYLIELEKKNALVVYRLEQLEQKVSQHNHFDSRLVALAEQVKTLTWWIKC